MGRIIQFNREAVMKLKKQKIQIECIDGKRKVDAHVTKNGNFAINRSQTLSGKGWNITFVPVGSAVISGIASFKKARLALEEFDASFLAIIKKYRGF